MRKIKFFIKNIIRVICTCTIFNIFLLKKDRYIFGQRDHLNKELFMHNSKYLFLYLNSIKKDCVWFTNDIHMQKEFKKRGLKAVKRYSLKGIFYALTSRYWIADFETFTSSISNFLPQNNIRINLWHGIPLKKIGYDAPVCSYYSLNKFEKIIYKLMRAEYNYYIAAGNFDAKNLSTAFDIPQIKLKQLGNPRLDAIYNDISHSEIFMEEDYENIKNIKNSGKKIIIYMPTYRNSNFNLTQWLESPNLKNILHERNITLICKLHPADMNNINIESSDEIFIMNSASDVYPILKFTDALITDYSSIAFDYLLTGNPIIFYPMDLDDYKQSCGDFYMPYEDFAVGKIAINETELIESIIEFDNNIDNYKQQRESLKKKLFKFTDGKNCERITNFIENL